jgi:hypothetical protein
MQAQISLDDKYIIIHLPKNTMRQESKSFCNNKLNLIGETK